MNTKDNEYLDCNDYELLYLISDNNEESNEIIFSKYKPVIEFYAKKYLPCVINKGIDYNDLYQEGLIGLDSALENFKEQKNIKFSTFAFTCIERKILSAVKIASRKKHSVLNDSLSIDESINAGDITYGDVISSDDINVEEKLIIKERQEELDKRLNLDLTSFEREVYKLRISGFSYDEISKKLNKTKKSIESSLARIKVKIKKIMEEIN